MSGDSDASSFWQWRKEGDEYRNSETKQTQKDPPPGIAQYWIGCALILLEEKFREYDDDSSGSLDLMEILNKEDDIPDEDRRQLTELFAEVDLNEDGELGFSEFFALVFSWTVKRRSLGLKLFFSDSGRDPSDSPIKQSISALEKVLEGFLHIADFVNNNSSMIDEKWRLEISAVQNILQTLFPGKEELCTTVLQRHFPDEAQPLDRVRFFLMVVYDVMAMIPETGVNGFYISSFESFIVPRKDWDSENRDVVIDYAMKLFEHRFTEFAWTGERSIKLASLVNDKRMWVAAKDREDLRKRIRTADDDGSQSIDFSEFFVMLRKWAAEKAAEDDEPAKPMADMDEAAKRAKAEAAKRAKTDAVVKYFFPSPANRKLIHEAFLILDEWLDKYDEVKRDPAKPSLSKSETDRLVSDVFRGTRYRHYKRVARRNFAVEDQELDLRQLWILLYDLMSSVDGSALKGTYLFAVERYQASVALAKSAKPAVWAQEALKVLEQRFAEFDVDGSGVGSEALVRGLPIGYEERKKLLDIISPHVHSSKNMTFAQFVGTLAAVHAEKSQDVSVLSYIFPSEANQAIISRFLEEFVRNKADPPAALEQIFKDAPALKHDYESVKGRYPLDKDMGIETYATLLYNVFCMETSSLQGWYLEVEIYPFSEALRRLEQFYSKHTKGGSSMSDLRHSITLQAMDIAEKFEALIAEKFEPLISTRGEESNEDFEFAEFLGIVFDKAVEDKLYDIEFLFEDKLEGKTKANNAMACAQSIVHLKGVVFRHINGGGPKSMWIDFNKKNIGDVMSVIHKIVCEVFPRYKEAYQDISKDSMEILSKMAQAKQLDSGNFMLHLYHIQTEVKGTFVDSTVRVAGTYKRPLYVVEAATTLTKYKVEFTHQFKEESQKTILRLEDDVKNLEDSRKDIQEKRTSLSELQKRYAMLQTKLAELKSPQQREQKENKRAAKEETDKAKNERDKAAKELNETKNKLKEIKDRVDQLQESIRAQNEERAEMEDKSDTNAKQSAFLARDTLVNPEEQLDSNDRDMVDSLIRNPGIGAFTISFIIAYKGLSLGKSSIATLHPNGEDTLDVEETLAEIVDFEKPTVDSSMFGSAAAIVQKGIDEIHVKVSVLLSSFLPILMLVVQFGYVYLIFSESMQMYSGAFCPGYDTEEYHIIAPLVGAERRVRVLMLFVGVYFLIKTFSQASTYFRALTERTIADTVPTDVMGPARMTRAILASIFHHLTGGLFLDKGQSVKDNGTQVSTVAHRLAFKGRVCDECKKYQAFFTPAYEIEGSVKKLDPEKAYCRSCITNGTPDSYFPLPLRYDLVARLCDLGECKTEAAFRIRFDTKDTEPTEWKIFKTAQSETNGPADNKGTSGAGEISTGAADNTATGAGEISTGVADNKATGAGQISNGAVDNNLKGTTGAGGKSNGTADNKRTAGADEKSMVTKEDRKEKWYKQYGQDPCNFRFCRTHAVEGCALLQHLSYETGADHRWLKGMCLPAETEHTCAAEDCYEYATHAITLADGGVTERLCKHHAEKRRDKLLHDLAEKAKTAVLGGEDEREGQTSKDLANDKGQHNEGQVEPKCQTSQGDQVDDKDQPTEEKVGGLEGLVAKKLAEAQSKIEELFVGFPKKENKCRMWRDVQDSGIYPLYCIDVCANLALVYCVLLCNLYIVFVTGISVQDILSKVVILDFIYMQQSNLKRELLQGAQSKKFLDGIRGVYNFGGYIRVNKVCSSFFAKLLYLLNIFPFLISAAMTIYGPLCKPGPSSVGVLPGD